MLLIPTDAEGFSRTQLDRKQGWWASDTATLYFDNVRVPVENLIGEENKGFLVIMTNFNSERMFMAAAMEALGRVCLEEAVNWARDRKTFGKRLADHQVIRHKIAQMKQKLNATQAYIRVCYESFEAGTPNPGDIALLKVQCSQTMEFCAREAMQILGGIGYMRGNKENKQTRFYTCFALALAATMGVAFAANLFTLFLFYEMLTLSTYPLVSHKGDPATVRSARVYLGILISASIALPSL